MASTDSPKIYTRAEVEKHNHNQSVWFIIHNKVYDVTAFLNEHPGGEEILLDHAGKDATQDFEDIGHSSDARQMMEPYKIGELDPSERSSAEKASKDLTSGTVDDDNSSGSWRSWLIPLAIGVLATLAYRYILNGH